MIEGDAIYIFEFTYKSVVYEENQFECDINYYDYGV